MRIPAAKAFTLIELLVVIGVIALMSGTLFLSLRGNDTAGLRSSQSVLGSMLAAARSQAALQNRNVAVMVTADSSDPDAYLHNLVLAGVKGSGWEQLGDPVALADGIYIVPPTPPGGSADFGPAVSTALTADNLAGKSTYAVTFTALGRAGQGGAIVLAPGTVQPGAATTPVVFKSADHVRGLIISAYGAVTFIDEKDGFQ